MGRNVQDIKYDTKLSKLHIDSTEQRTLVHVSRILGFYPRCPLIEDT